MPQLRIGAMFLEHVRAFLVIENAAEPVAGSAGSQPGSYPRFADGIHIDAEIDQLRQQLVPSAVPRAEQGVLPKGCLALWLDAEIQQKLHRFERLRLCDSIL